MRCLWIAVAALLAAAPAAAETDAQAVERTFHEIRRLARERNAAALERLVDPGFVMNHGFGPSEPRDVWLALMRDGKLRVQTSDGDERRTYVRLFGDTAVRGWITRFRNPERNVEDWFRGIAVFVRRDGGWRKISQQSSLLNAGKIVEPPPLAPFAGAYQIEGRGPMRIEADDGMLAMFAEGGVETPLVPLGGDRFKAGAISVMTFERDATGRVVAVDRGEVDGSRRWWRATRTKD